MYNYKGYFNSLNNIPYEVRIITNSATSIYKEITLAGDRPFVATWEESDTPFSSLRISTAEINIVSDDYLLDIYPAKARDVQVQLWNTNTSSIEWCGFVKPFITNQGYEQCYETITLQASDCLATLQYYDYTPIEGVKKMQSFLSVVRKLMNEMQQIEGAFIGKKYVNDIAYTGDSSDKVIVSEKNYFSDDYDEEPWKCDEVLEEWCKYLGYTCLQWKGRIYFLNTAVLLSASTYSGFYYPVYETGTTQMTLDTEKFISASSYMGNGGQISFEQVYNKCSVEDDFYLMEDLIPPIYDDDYLTNVLGESWKCEEIPAYSKNATYINQNNNVKTEDVSDYKYSYFQKEYTHEWYDSVYYDSNGNPVDAASYANIKSDVISSADSTLYTRRSVNFYNQGDSAVTITAYAYIIVRWWDSEAQIYDQVEDEDYQTFTLAAGESVQKQFYASVTDPAAGTSKFTDHEAKFNVNGGSYVDFGSEIKPEGTYRGAVVTDIASYTNYTYDSEIASYNAEEESSLDFTRYLRVYQGDFPFGYQNPRASGQTLGDVFPVAFKLKSGWYNPIAIDDDSFLYINASAIWERYTNRPYINPDWESQNTGYNGKYNYIDGTTNKVRTLFPCLILKLGIGNYFWNGEKWIIDTTHKTSFTVDMSTPVEEDGSPDWSAWWNTEQRVLNNVSWQDWATDAKGYKIPLSSDTISLDFNKEITFEVHFPSKLQYYGLSKTSDGFNSYCWIKDLSVKVAHKGTAKNSDKEDTKYENIIEDGAVNELNEENFQITSYDGKNMVAYSNCIFKRGSSTVPQFVTGITDTIMSMTDCLPEQNYITNMVNQYSSLTKKENITVDLSFTPLGKVVDRYWNQDFVILGQEIDYAYDRQDITICQIKSPERKYGWFDETAIELDDTQQSFSNYVSSNTDWHIVLSDDSWMSVDPESGSTGYQFLDCSVMYNSSSSARTGYYYLYDSDDNLLDTCTIVQDAYETPYLNVSPAQITYTSGGGQAVITVNSNICSNIWISGNTPPTPTPTITGISFYSLVCGVDVPATGGTADTGYCQYTIVGNRTDGYQVDVTSLCTVSGELVVPATTEASRHSAGTLTLTATYSGFTVSKGVTVYQEGTNTPYITLDTSSIVFDISGGTATINVSSNIDWYLKEL